MKLNVHAVYAWTLLIEVHKVIPNTSSSVDVVK